MAEATKHLVIAPKLTARDRVPDGWQQRVGEIPGVEVLGSGGGMMQVRATAQALETVTKQLGDVLNVEEAAPRRTDL